MRSILRALGGLAMAGALAACGSGEPDMINLSNSGPGPDEFAIVPNRPLERPVDATLPPPAPGAANRADAAPQADAVAALGGNPAAAGGAADPGLTGYAGRYGTDAAIRSRLAAEDLAFRQRRGGRVLERVFNVTTYYDAYAAQSLDQYRALETLRRAGIRTPAAPPAAIPSRPVVAPLPDGPSAVGPSSGANRPLPSQD